MRISTHALGVGLKGQPVTDLRGGAAQDIGTLDSGLNSMVLASNNEMVLLPVNEPTFGTKRKSQIQVRICAAALHLTLECNPFWEEL